MPLDAMRFFSDNAAAACPAVLDALAEANRLDTAYDGDEWSSRLDSAHSRPCSKPRSRALWVTTGTAANCLGLATLCPPYGAIICHRDAHIEVDEAGAPGFYTHGAKLMLVDGPGAKLTRRGRRRGAGANPRRRPPGPAQGRVDHQRHRIWPDLFAGGDGALGEFARSHGLGFHLDGARFANAVVSTGASPADLSWRAGVDVMSFGFVKNGGMNAEALIFFRTELADEALVLRKRAGHLLSKGRYLAAQILAMLEERRLARQCARRQCRRAGAGRGCGQRGWSIRSRPMSCSCA